MGSEWKPIESAPRDGACILIAGSWDDEPFMMSASYTTKHPVFCWQPGMDASAINGRFVTHWMPLPPPPETDQ